MSSVRGGTVQALCSLTRPGQWGLQASVAWDQAPATSRLPENSKLHAVNGVVSREVLHCTAAFPKTNIWQRCYWRQSYTACTWLFSAKDFSKDLPGQWHAMTSISCWLQISHNVGFALQILCFHLTGPLAACASPMATRTGRGTRESPGKLTSKLSVSVTLKAFYTPRWVLNFWVSWSSGPNKCRFCLTAFLSSTVQRKPKKTKETTHVRVWMKWLWKPLLGIK